MDSSMTDDKMMTPIVALACQGLQGDLSIVRFKTPHLLKDFKFKEEKLMIGNVCFHYFWFNSITLCTNEILEEIEQELQNA